MPWRDWSAVTTGHKRMFRQPIAALGAGLLHAPKPGPVIAYTLRPRISEYERRMMVLEGFRIEPLGAISPADLEREGFDSLKEFRRYWNGRFSPKARGFDPLMKVGVVELRPWEHGYDEVMMGAVLLQHLYGEVLDAPVAAA